MPYEILEVELTGNTSKLDKVLADVDARLAKMASGTYKVAVGAGSSGVNAINAATTATNKLTDSQMRYKREVQDATATATKNYRQLDQALSKIANSKYAEKLTGLNNEIRSGSLKGAEALQKVNSEIRQLGVESNKSDGFLKKVWSTIKQFGTAYLVIQGLRTGFNALTDATLHYNEILENAQIGLTNLLGGSKALAKNLLDQLQQFAIVTPFQFSDLVPYVAQLKAVGFAYKDILPTIKAVGEASAGTGLGNDGMQRIIYALGQIRAEGKLTGRVMHELQQAEIPATRYLAEAFGVTTGKVKELVREGLIPADAAIKAITAGINKPPSQGGFAGSLEAQSKTFLGTLSNIGDALKKVLGGATENAFNGLTKLASKFQDFVSSDEFQVWADRSVKSLLGVLGHVEGLYNFTVDHWPEVQTVLTLMAAGWAAVKIQAGQAAIAEGLAAAASGETAGLTGIAALAANVGPNLKNAVAPLASVFETGEFLPAIADIALKYLPTIAVVAGTIGTYFGVAAEKADALNAATVDVYKNTRQIKEALSEAIQYGGNDDKLVKKLANIKEEIANAGSDAGKLQNILKELSDAKSEIKLSTKLGNSTKRLLMDDIGMSEDFVIAKPALLRVEMDKESQTWWGQFFQDLRDWSGFSPTKANVDKNGKKITGVPNADGYIPLGPQAGQGSSNPFSALGNLYKPNWMQALGLHSNLKAAADAEQAGGSLSLGGTANGKAAAKLEKDRLSDAAKLYNELGKAAEDSAKRQIDALTKVNDVLKDLLGGFQEGLAKYGILNSPLDAIIAKIQKMVDLGPRAAAAAQQGLGVSQGFYTHALHANMALDKMNGGDGREPAAASRLGLSIANSALQMQTSGAAKGFQHLCESLARTTVQKVTHAYDSYFSHSSAKQTMHNFQRGGVGQAYKSGMALAPGDLLYSGAGASGHAMVVGPDGRILDQYGANRTPKVAPQWLVRAGGKATATGVGLAEGQGGDVVQAAMALFQNLSLSKLAPLPKEWGKPIADSEAHAAEFKIQMLLADKATQDFLRGQIAPDKWPAFIKLLRSAGIETDKWDRHGAINLKLRDEAKSVAAIGHENDPVFLIRQRMQEGGDLFNASQYDIARAKLQAYGTVTRTASVELNKFIQSKRNEKQALSEAAPFMRGQTADLFAYNRQLAITKERQSYAQSDGMLKLWNTNKAEFNKNLRTHMGAFTSGMDNEAGNARGNDYIQANKALDDRTFRLNRQLSTVMTATVSEQGLNDALDKQAYYYEQVDRLYAQNGDMKRAEQLAAHLSVMNAVNVAIERRIGLERENRQANASADASLGLNSVLRGIYGSTASGSIEQQKKIQQAQLDAALNADIKSGKYAGAGGANLIVDRRQRERKALDDSFATDATKDAGALKLTQLNSLLDQNLAINTKRLDNMYQLSDVQKQQLEFDNENTKDMLAMKDVTPDIIDFQDKYIENLKTLQNLQRQAKINADNDALAAYGVPSGRQRDKFLRDQATMHDANLSGKDKGDQINREDILAQAQQADQALQEVASSLSGAWSSSMGTILSSTDSTFRKITDLAGSLVQDVGNYFEKLAEQYLANQAIGFLLKSTGLGSILGPLQDAVSQGAPTTPVLDGGAVSVSDPSASKRSTVVNIYHSGNVVANDPIEYQKKVTQMASKNQSIDSERTNAQSVADINNLGSKNR